jgi:26S proteasome regulatory subunit N12
MDPSNRSRSLINNYQHAKSEKEKTDILKSLKLLMLTFKTLPPSKEVMNQSEYYLAREILEIEMGKYLDSQDEKNFELAYLKIKQFYFDYSDSLTKSDKMLYFVGLYLLHLLANNRTTEFCTELESLDFLSLNDSWVKVSRDLETCIMEGNYKHIISIKSRVQNQPHYNYYLKKFDEAIKFQIARSAEKSYESLRLNDAVELLMLQNQTELVNFIKNESENLEEREIEWKILNDRLIFHPINKEKTSIPSHRVIDNTVKMGVELEKII